jgi:hypothetical protein
MQFLKANYFNSPPRTADEIIALLLSLHDGSSTPIFPSDIVPGLSLHNTEPDPDGGDFVAVTGINGVPVQGTVGTALPLA